MVKPIRWGGLAALALASCVALAACSSDNTPSGQPEGSSSAGGSAQASPPAPGDPFGKYDPPIELTTVRTIDASYKFAEGESLDKNIWTPIMEDELGIKVKNLWVVDASQYAQKLNVALSSNDLPDFMAVDRVVMQRLMDAGLLEDLTQVYDEYASPYVKQALVKDGGESMKSVTVGGKLMAIPQTAENNGVASASMIWVRTDWLKKLNLSEPKTMDDVFAIAEAFAKRDPDGDGKADTIGLGMNKDLFKDSGSLIGFFNGYHAYPTFWVKDASGKLAEGTVQPEMRPALEKLAQLYKDGIIDKEFSVKPWKKMAEDAAAGRLGLAFGYVADATTFYKDSRANDPNADWKAFPIVSVDDKPAIPQVNDTATSFFVVKKGTPHPEAVVKLLNLYMKKYLDTDYTGSKNPFITDTATGIFPAKYFPIMINPSDININAYKQVVEELDKGGDGKSLTFPASVHFDRITKFRAGDDSTWFSERTFGPDGSFGVIDKYNTDGTYQFNAFNGAPTPTMVEKDATLQKMRDEVITKVIMGAAPVGDYDKFIGEWRKLGGDQIEKEVNEWYDNNH